MNRCSWGPTSAPHRLTPPTGADTAEVLKRTLGALVLFVIFTGVATPGAASAADPETIPRSTGGLAWSTYWWRALPPGGFLTECAKGSAHRNAVFAIPAFSAYGSVRINNGCNADFPNLLANKINVYAQAAYSNGSTCVGQPAAGAANSAGSAFAIATTAPPGCIPAGQPQNAKGVYGYMWYANAGWSGSSAVAF
jgi:hypothetical protein